MLTYWAAILPEII